MSAERYPHAWRSRVLSAQVCHRYRFVGGAAVPAELHADPFRSRLMIPLYDVGQLVVLVGVTLG
jgi:hypothetical protein